jgi:hypothetical protein
MLIAHSQGAGQRFEPLVDPVVFGVFPRESHGKSLIDLEAWPSRCPSLAAAEAYSWSIRKTVEFVQLLRGVFLQVYGKQLVSE